MLNIEWAVMLSFMKGVYMGPGYLDLVGRFGGQSGTGQCDTMSYFLRSESGVQQGHAVDTRTPSVILRSLCTCPLPTLHH